jgi:hypothetical protein
MKAKLKLPAVNRIFEALVTVSKNNELTFSERFKLKKLIGVFQDDAVDYAQQFTGLIKEHTTYSVDEKGVITYDKLLKENDEIDTEHWEAFVGGVEEIDRLEDEYEFEPLTLSFIGGLKSNEDDFNVLVDNRIVIE